MYTKRSDASIKQITESPQWTLATLQVYLSKVGDERDRTYQQRWEASEEATATALIAAKEAVAMALQAQKEAVATAFIAQEKAVAAALASAERAVTKAEQAAEKRFDSVNEFRAQLSDQAGTFFPRAEFDRAASAINDKIEARAASQTAKIEAAIKTLEGKIDANGLKIETSDKHFAGRIEDLRSSRDTSTGKSSGLNAGWMYLLGALSLVQVGVALMLLLSKH